MKDISAQKEAITVTLMTTPMIRMMPMIMMRMTLSMLSMILEGCWVAVRQGMVDEKVVIIVGYILLGHANKLSEFNSESSSI